MIIGNEKLKELYPSFMKDIKENGIDLRVDKVEQLIVTGIVGIIHGDKHLPQTLPIPITKSKCYILKGGQQYLITLKGEMTIPDGYCQLYYLRSTLMRCGLILSSSVGDNGYTGELKMIIHNPTTHDVWIGQNEKIIQCITIKNDGTATTYNGDYQNNKIYKEQK